MVRGSDPGGEWKGTFATAAEAQAAADTELQRRELPKLWA